MSQHGSEKVIAEYVKRQGESRDYHRLHKGHSLSASEMTHSLLRGCITKRLFLCAKKGESQKLLAVHENFDVLVTSSFPIIAHCEVLSSGQQDCYTFACQSYRKSIRVKSHTISL